MALLTRRSRIALLCAAVFGSGSCGGSDVLGKVDVYARDCGERSCDAPPVSSGSNAHHFITQAFIDPDASRYAPHGLYVYFELEHPNGTLTTVEFDVPTDRAQGVDDYQARYRELDSDATLRFEATDMQGTIAPPPTGFERDDACACLQGSFALRFTNPGPDGTLGTGDDAQRELLHGRLGSEEGWCAPVGPFSMGDGLRVARADCGAPSGVARSSASSAPPTSSSVARSSSGSTGTSVAVAAQTDVWLEPDDDGACGSSRPSRSYDDGGGSCSSTSSTTSGGGTSSASTVGESSDGGSSACEGDRYEDDSSSSGACQEDHDDHQGQACRIGAAPHTSPRLRARSSTGAFTGLGLPLLLCYLALALRTRVGRQRQTRAGAFAAEVLGNPSK